MAPAVAVALSIGVAVTGLAAGTASAAGTPGVTASRVTIGATYPATGIASIGYSEVALAANAVFSWINSHGKINGRTIKFVLKDDCYGTPGFGCTGNPSTTAQTQALLATPVFATVGSLGTPTQESVRNLLKAHGVPQLFVNSGSAAWNNPSHYPMLFGWQQSYVVEGKILGTYIKKHLTGKVCFLGQNDDFGKGGLNGLNQVGVHPALVKYYSVASLVFGGAAYFTPFIQAEQAAACKNVILYTIPGATAAALGNALALTYSPKWVISSVGSDPITVKKEAAGAFSDVGAITFAELPASTDLNPWNAWDRKVLMADSVDFPGFGVSTPIDGNMAYGIGWGVSFAEALRAEGKTVTRAGFIATLLKTAFQTPALTPLKYSKSNHQGLLGGYVDTVTSDTATTAAPGKTVYTTTDAAKSKVVVTHRLSTTVPSWLH